MPYKLPSSTARTGKETNADLGQTNWQQWSSTRQPPAADRRSLGSPRRNLTRRPHRFSTAPPVYWHHHHGTSQCLPLGGCIHHDIAPRRWVGRAPRRRVGVVCPLAERGNPGGCGGGLTSRRWYLRR
ncbi:hypothetical protein VPH35_002409 [Triticum aestivum]